MKPRLRVLFIIVLLVMMLPTACSPKTQEQETPIPNPGLQNLNVDKDLTIELLNEKAIQSGLIYEQSEKMVVGTMVIKEGISKSEIEELANKYARDLKEKYPERRVNVQAVQGGENVVNIELD